MKKYLCLFLTLFVLSIEMFALNENVVVWERIYQDTSTDEQRISVLLKIMDLGDREFAPVLVKALEQLITRRLETGTTAERYGKNQLAILIVQELGNLKSAEAAELIFSVYTEVKEPVLKGEAAIALGKIRATRYAETLAYDLSSLNLRPDPAISRNQEILALGLVQSLNSMRSLLGYEPVFHASFGWYSRMSKVKETAKAALLTMVDDPTDSLLSILVTNPSIEIKTTALEASLASKAPAERKALVASKALRIGIERANIDKTSEAESAKLRVTAITGLTALRDKTPENITLLVGIINSDKKNDASYDETLKAYVALGVNSGDEAATFLSARLGEYNIREKSKANTVRDKSIIRQIVASMVYSKNPLVKNVLTQSQFIDYDSLILREIESAIKTFP